MNKRIKELAEQNGFIHNWMPPGEQHDKLKSLEKFAELLTKDFQDMIKQVYLETEPEHRACLLALDAKVEEHFGVEE